MLVKVVNTDCMLVTAVVVYRLFLLRSSDSLLSSSRDNPTALLVDVNVASNCADAIFASVNALKDSLPNSIIFSIANTSRNIFLSSPIASWTPSACSLSDSNPFSASPIPLSFSCVSTVSTLIMLISFVLLFRERNTTAL